MPKIFAPDGSIVTQRNTVRLPSGFMKTLAAFADVATELGLGLHCSRCKHDVGGENNSQSPLWKMECECTTYVGGGARTSTH